MLLRGDFVERKIILYIAMTLDGYIADQNDQLTFLDPYNENELAKNSYQDLMNRTDTLLIGRKTYDVISQLVSVWPYPNHHTYVLTSKPGINLEKVSFTSQNIKELVEDLRKSPGKDIWIVGGGKLVQSLIQLDLINEYHIAIAPILLGRGVPLFHQVENSINLKLIKSEVCDQLTLMVYHHK